MRMKLAPLISSRLFRLETIRGWQSKVSHTRSLPTAALEVAPIHASSLSKVAALHHLVWCLSSRPLCNYFDDSRNGVVDGGVFMKSQKSLDVWAAQMERVPAGISDAVPLDVQHNGRDVGIAAQDCSLDDGASLAL